MQSSETLAVLKNSSLNKLMQSIRLPAELRLETYTLLIRCDCERQEKPSTNTTSQMASLEWKLKANISS